MLLLSKMAYWNVMEIAVNIEFCNIKAIVFWGQMKYTYIFLNGGVTSLNTIK